MRIILLERIRSLGYMGDVVEVKPGFARNFLLPQKKALRATDANLKVFESRKKVLEAENIKGRQEAEKLRDRLKDFTICLERSAGEAGQLYGSVTDRNIADGAAVKGLQIDRKQIFLKHPIKNIGVHRVIIALHPEIEIDALVSVATSLDAAEAAIEEFRNPKPVEEVKQKSEAAPKKKAASKRKAEEEAPAGATAE